MHGEGSVKFLVFTFDADEWRLMRRRVEQIDARWGDVKCALFLIVSESQSISHLYIIGALNEYIQTLGRLVGGRRRPRAHFENARLVPCNTRECRAECDGVINV
jgi:hypothetical protein